LIDQDIFITIVEITYLSGGKEGRCFSGRMPARRFECQIPYMRQAYQVSEVERDPAVDWASIQTVRTLPTMIGVN